MQLGDVDVEGANLVGFEPLWLFAIRFRQARDAMTLKAAMQGGARQMRNNVLQGEEDVIQRQAGLHPERDDRSLFDGGQDRASPLLGSHRLILDHRTGTPLPHGFLVDPVAPREFRDRSFRSL